MQNVVSTAEEAKTLMTVDRSAITADGEVIEFRPDVPFRSITDLKAFSDNEKSDMPTLTDESLYEPLEDIFRRCQRGELIAQKRGQYAGSDVDDEDLYDVDDFEDLTDIDAKAENLAQEALKARESTTQAGEQGARMEPNQKGSNEQAVSETAKAEKKE